MEFCCFTPVPWPALDRRPDEWPFPNTDYDANGCAECFDNAVEQLVHAEACGFDWVGMGEDHMTAYGLTPNPLILLAQVAARTSRVKLATMGCPLPLLNPVRVAEEMAMLDVLSNGRMVAGLIRGVPQNYAAYGVDPQESRSRFAEGVELVAKAWTHEGVTSWEGEHYTFPKLSIWPRPVTQPHPPFLFSANSVESAEFGARWRAHVGAIHMYNLNALERVRASIDAYRAVAHADGWDPTPNRFLIGLPTCIAPTDAEANDLLDAALDYQFTKLSGTYNAEKRRIAKEKPGYGLSPTEENPPTLSERLEAGIVLCGSPDTVVDQVRSLESRLGVGLITMHTQVGNLAHDAVMRGLDLFRERVRPAFAATEASA